MIKRAHLLALLLPVMALGGCMTTSRKQIRTPFNEQEFAPYGVDGSATLRGQTFLKTRGGDVKYGAGDTVTLIPATSYSREVWEDNIRGESTVVDPRWSKYNRTTVADATGNFEFTRLPAGDYFLQCPIFWEVPGKYGLYQTGAVARAEVSVRAGEVVKVVLTD